MYQLHEKLIAKTRKQKSSSTARLKPSASIVLSDFEWAKNTFIALCSLKLSSRAFIRSSNSSKVNVPVLSSSNKLNISSLDSAESSKNVLSTPSSFSSSLISSKQKRNPYEVGSQNADKKKRHLPLSKLSRCDDRTSITVTKLLIEFVEHFPNRLAISAIPSQSFRQIAIILKCGTRK